MELLMELETAAREYAERYPMDEDPETREAIYASHLVYLINREFN